MAPSPIAAPRVIGSPAKQPSQQAAPFLQSRPPQPNPVRSPEPGLYPGHNPAGSVPWPLDRPGDSVSRHETRVNARRPAPGRIARPLEEAPGVRPPGRPRARASRPAPCFPSAPPRTFSSTAPEKRVSPVRYQQVCLPKQRTEVPKMGPDVSLVRPVRVPLIVCTALLLVRNILHFTTTVLAARAGRTPCPGGPAGSV
jgi:hypothetical protein